MMCNNIIPPLPLLKPLMYDLTLKFYENGVWLRDLQDHVMDDRNVEVFEGPPCWKLHHSNPPSPTTAAPSCNTFFPHFNTSHSFQNLTSLHLNEIMQHKTSQRIKNCSQTVWKENYCLSGVKCEGLFDQAVCHCPSGTTGSRCQQSWFCGGGDS